MLLIGAGMITGLRVSLSMLLGSVLLYFVVAPRLVVLDLTHIHLAGYVPSLALRPDGGFNPTRWALWGGTSIMVFSSLATVALQWRTLARAFTLFKKSERPAHSAAMDAIEVPASWLVAGLIPITLGLVLVQYLAFHISIMLGLIAVALSFVVSLVCCRATGETDTTPIGAMGKLTQLLYAALPGAKGVASINLMAAGVTASAGGRRRRPADGLEERLHPGREPAEAVHRAVRRPLLRHGGHCARLVCDGAQQAGVGSLQSARHLHVESGSGLAHAGPAHAAGHCHLGHRHRRAGGCGAARGREALPESASLSAVGYGPGPFVGDGLSEQPLLCHRGGAGGRLDQAEQEGSDLYYVPVASGLIAGESLIAALIAIACTVVGLLAAK